MYTKAEFKKNINAAFQLDGFKLKSAVQAFLLKRTIDNRTETITLSYRDYASHGFYIDGISADIFFEEVEGIINPLLELFNIENSYGNTTIQKILINIDGVDYSKFQTEINNESTFNIVYKEISKIISLGAIPFFERYNTLEAVNQDLFKMNEDEVSNFLSGIIGIKLPLIKKLVNSPDFKNELLKRYNFYKNEAFEYPQYFKDHDKLFNEVFSQDLKNNLIK